METYHSAFQHRDIVVLKSGRRVLFLKSLGDWSVVQHGCEFFWCRTKDLRLAPPLNFRVGQKARLRHNQKPVVVIAVEPDELVIAPIGAGCVHRIHPGELTTPPTVSIGDQELLAPEREALKEGTKYYVPDLEEPFFQQRIWSDSPEDKTLLDRGLVFLKEAEAMDAVMFFFSVMRGH